MMFVVTAAAGSALFAKVWTHSEFAGTVGLKTDVPSLLLLAIGLTAIAIGAWKEHSAVQTMLQMTLAFLGCLSLIWIGEAKLERLVRYWFEVAFALTVCLPMLARRYVKANVARGPRRDWWKKTCEAVFFSFVTVMLVTAGAFFQFGAYYLTLEWLAH
jgi:hypothetical protein